ncbi:MAG: fluoride efflux transporter CrcB [Candidatus Mycalebacterium zealandia]|nr:MAG: fluoride efflux transporter CrcB [Candidatus Mycalebacterium zealandia]
MVWNLICVMAGGAAGSGLRYIFFRAVPSASFPVGTLGVNIIGSFLIGLAYIHFQNRIADESMRLLLMTGLLGGFTTFSAFSLETLNLIQNGNLTKAGLNIVLSVSLCLIACFAGMWTGNRV